MVAGIADAVGYVTMNGVFAANMTGNTVLAGIDLAKGNHLGAWNHLTPLVAFFPGAMLARVLVRLFKGPRAAILIEAALIAGVGFLPISQEDAVMIVAFAMGLQASAITSFAGHTVSTVVVTSTLARMADATVDRLWRSSATTPPPAISTWLLTLTWTGYLLGAVIGGLLLTAMPYPLIVPAILLLPVLLLKE